MTSYKSSQGFQSTKRTSGGVHIVPKDQVEEFMGPGGIDYDALILDCYPEPQRRQIKRKMTEHNFSFKCKDLNSNNRKKINTIKG